MKYGISCLIALLLVIPAAAQLVAPANTTAGEGVSLGRGKGELLVFGPATAIKRKVNGDIRLNAEDVRKVGTYVAILDDETKTFYVQPGPATNLNFIARPSRVPVSQPDVVIGVAFVFDAQQNLVVKPTWIKFELALAGSPGLTRAVESRNGVAWVRTASGSREGPAEFSVEFANGKERAEVKRVVQQVAGDPCNIRMRAERKGDSVEVVTDAVRDCSGNAVPDGTIVTFIQSAPNHTRSTVDARIKRGIARATLPAISGATISVASGIVLGNEIRLGGGGQE
jgi:hypothetical protein